MHLNYFKPKKLRITVSLYFLIIDIASQKSNGSSFRDK